MSKDDWISKDKPPEQDITVIVHSKKYGVVPAQRTWVGNYWCDKPRTHLDDVTHWQPLPDPPIK